MSKVSFLNLKTGFINVGRRFGYVWVWILKFEIENGEVYRRAKFAFLKICHSNPNLVVAVSVNSNENSYFMVDI